MRRVDVKKLAASYGLIIDEKNWIRHACNGKTYKAMGIMLRNWKFEKGLDGLWDLVPASGQFIIIGTFGPDGPDLLPPDIVNQQNNPEGCFEVNFKVADFVRNRSTYYSPSIFQKFWNLDDLKQFFDDFYAKWVVRRKLHKIKEISSVSDDYTV